MRIQRWVCRQPLNLNMKIELEALLRDLADVYPRSRIAAECLKNGDEWFYSLATTTLRTGGPMVVGFNWGVSKDHRPQFDIMPADFSKEDVGSLVRIFPYCREAFGEGFLSNVTQTNYCFFRSKTEGQISNDDLALCEPLFDRLLRIVQPSSILCLSTRLRGYLQRTGKLTDMSALPIAFVRGTRTVTYHVLKARMINGTPISFLPHPNYPMTATARTQAWRFCFPPAATSVS
jgi:hypothetical protein